MLLLFILLPISYQQLTNQNNQVCPQCPPVPIGQLQFIDNLYNNFRDCFCGEQAKILINCNGNPPNLNFPYQGNDCPFNILTQELQWHLCIFNSTKRDFIPNSGQYIRNCAYLTGAKVTLPLSSTFTPTSSPTANSTPTDSSLLIIIIAVSILIFIIATTAVLLHLICSPKKNPHSTPT
ncbi:hypothetical protein HDV02_005568, partial [Globomyces sp. JEL0801]